jgi:hypothetical protein
MLLLEKAANKKGSRIQRNRIRVLWITIMVIGLMIIAGTILIASMDNYDWLR